MELFNPNQMAAEFAPLMNLGTGEMKNPVRAFYRRMASNYNARSANQNTAIAAMNGLTPEAFDQAVADDLSLGADALGNDPQTGMIQGSIGSQAMNPASMSPVGQMMSGNPQFAPGAAIPEGGAPQTMPGQIDPAEVDNALKRYAEIVAQRPKAPKQERAQLSDGAATLAILVGLFGGDRRAAVDVLAGALQGSQQYADATNKQNVFDFEQELADWEAKLKPAELEAEIKSKLFQSQMTQQGMNQRADMMNDRALTVAGINADARLQNTQIQQQGANQRAQMQLEQKDRQFVLQNASQNERKMFDTYLRATPGMRLRIAQTLRDTNPVFMGLTDQELEAVALEATVPEKNQALNQDKFESAKEQWRMNFDEKVRQFGLTFSQKQKESAFKRQDAIDRLELARQKVVAAKTEAERKAAKDEWTMARKEHASTMKLTADDKAYEAANKKISELRARQKAIVGSTADAKERRKKIEDEITEVSAVRDMYAQNSSKAMQDAILATDVYLNTLDSFQGVKEKPKPGELPAVDPFSSDPPPADNNPPKGAIGGNPPGNRRGDANRKPNRVKSDANKPKTQKTKKGTEFEIEG